jgi:hypothetical protein
MRKAMTMEKTKKPKASTASKAAKPASDYKPRDPEGKTTPSDAAFQKASGKGKSVPKKG